MVDKTKYLTISQAAKKLGVTRVTIWNWRQAGKIKAVVPEGSTREHVAVSEVDRILYDRTHYYENPENNPGLKKVLEEGAQEIAEIEDLIAQIERRQALKVEMRERLLAVLSGRG
jgi:excisionase family DNA binding protein